MSNSRNLNRNGISFEKLAETSPAAITEVDKHGNILFANSKAKDVFTLEKSEITDRTYDDPDWKIADLLFEFKFKYLGSWLK